MMAMDQHKTLNTIIIVGSAAALAIFFFFIRRQTAFYDQQLLRDMMPRHSQALLMCP